MDPYVLNISPDKMTASLILRPPQDGAQVTVDDIKGFLQDSGIVFGLNEQVLAEALSQNKWDEELIVAVGSKPENGENGSVKFHFDTSPKGRPTELENGRLDFFDLHTAQCVKAGDILAELIPPVEGKPGTNIMGEQIPSPFKGRPSKIPRGRNTTFKDESKSQLVAEIDGNVNLSSSGSIEVSKTMAIRGDIDLSTGNIEVVGDLVINGDVKSGFKVGATGNIEIGGTVEDAHVRADGNVVVKGGFLGEGNGEIKSNKSVFVKYVYRQSIYAKENIEIFEESTQANLCAEGIIKITKGKGILVGGKASAGKALEARIIGNDQGAPTEIMVGGKAELLKEMENLHRNNLYYDEKLSEIADQMSRLMSKKKKVGLLPKDEEKFRILDKLSADIDRSIQTNAARLTECEEELEETKRTAYIDVSKTVYSSVTIRIAGLSKFIENEREKTRFKISGSKIIGIEDD